MTGAQLDLEDLYNADDPDPAKTYLSVLPYWEHDVEKLESGLKFERGPSFTVAVNGYVVYKSETFDASKNFQHGRDISRKGWGHKKIRKKQRMRPAGWHGNHPEQKPRKRWDRQTLESIIMPDGSVVTIQEQTDRG